ncbi:MAG: hypothetical protein J0H12_01070 [Candidatus Paracaedimonas acanthamoebae]|uniref:Uncharacterized protein n=1 Tax=Candidatus Paracaedimonas acanthamoebae TaxID=244581 RepID=A0A8J7TU88_9PROT|nr:hypothetical protein [Candidatus Paracaedimonas acanthamoebae]
MVYEFYNNKRLPNSLIITQSPNLKTVGKHSLLLSSINEIFINKTVLPVCDLVLPPKKPSSFNAARLHSSRKRILKSLSSQVYGVPPTPAIEGREESRASLPSIHYNTYKQENNSIDAQTINKFGMNSMPSDEKYLTSRKASLSTQQSSGLRAAGFTFREGQELTT